MMKKICFVLIATLLLPCFCYSVHAEKISYKNQTVYHFFTHALLADKHLAFDENNPMRYDYDRDCITPFEFKSILQELYNNDFILVDIYDVFQNGNKKYVEVQKGKKPMILSFDDINYYVKKMHLGMNDKLVVDSHGSIASEINGNLHYDNEVITCLETFLAEHPDFSLNDARGIICLTGFDGVLGYRTNLSSPNFVSERIMAKQVISAMKKLGWRFACHSYGHGHMKKISLTKFMNDTKKWEREVSILTGATDLYCYPYGEWVMDDKQKILASSGYKLFFGVGIDAFYNYLPIENSSEKCLVMDRVPLDGRTMRSYRYKLSKYFDVDKVYDVTRFIPLES